MMNSSPSSRTRSALGAIALAATSSSFACGGESPGSLEKGGADGRAPTAPRSGEKSLPPPPVPLGGQSGAEGGCGLVDAIEGVTPEQEIEGFGYRVADVLAFVEGARSAELAWATLAPPGGAGSTERVTVEVSLAGLARAEIGCGGTFQIPVSFRVRSESGALALEGASTLQASRQRGTLRASFALDSLPDWHAAAGPVLNLSEGGSFELYLSFAADQTLRGSFMIRGTSMCQLAVWPLTPTCDDGTSAIDSSHPLHGERVRELFQRLEALQVPELGFSDGTRTDLSLSVESPPTHACVRRNASGNGQLLPGELYETRVPLRLTTGDGRADVLVPVRASALLDAGAWTEPSFHTEGVVLAPAEGFDQLALEPLGLTGRAALRLSARRAEGRLELSSFAPRSPELREVINTGCITVSQLRVGQEFAGVLSDVLSASWPEQ